MSFKALPYDPASCRGSDGSEEDDIEKVMAASRSLDHKLLPPTLLHEENVFTGPDGNKIRVTILRRKGAASAQGRIGIYHLHGGGMMLGSRQDIVPPEIFELLDELDGVLVSIEYRLATAHPDPAIIEDCYAGLVWMADNTARLTIDPSRIMIGGVSAGGGLAAGVCLLAGDRKGPVILSYQLVYLMLDDHCNTVSTQGFWDKDVWSGKSNM